MQIATKVISEGVAAATMAAEAGATWLDINCGCPQYGEQHKQPEHRNMTWHTPHAQCHMRSSCPHLEPHMVSAWPPSASHMLLAHAFSWDPASTVQALLLWDVGALSHAWAGLLYAVCSTTTLVKPWQS